MLTNVSVVVSVAATSPAECAAMTTARLGDRDGELNTRSKIIDFGSNANVDDLRYEAPS